MNNENDSTVTFCTFSLCQRLFGISILDIKEINNDHRFTSINHAPDEIKGYVNIRGNLYLIADMRKIMGFTKNGEDDFGKLIIFKPRLMELFGILVDDIGDTVTVVKTDVFDRRSSGMGSAEVHEDQRKDDMGIGLGVVKLEQGLLIALNTRNLVKKFTQ